MEIEANIVSVFGGMACGMLAMMEAGVKVGRYVAFEIDKYAVKTSSHNFPQIEHRGDVFQADFREFEGFDWLVGGSPCTYWSIAQKDNRETEASGLGWELFCQYLRALKEVKPRFFIYENNKSMAKAIRQSITETFGFDPICINSALVSAQNRQRLYWVGKRNEDGSYSKVDVQQPEDRGILLKDVLDGVAWMDKSYTIDSNYHKTLGQQGFDRQSGRRKMVAGPVRVGTWPNTAKNQAHDSQQYRIYSAEGKGVTLCGNGGGMGAKTGLYAVPVNETADGKSQYLRASCCKDGIRNMVGNDIGRKTCVAEPTPGYAIAVEWDEAGRPIKAVSHADGKAHPVYEVKDGYITIKGKKYTIKLADGYWIIRKLTVSECKRLQTVPEWFEFPVSDTQAYKMLGNGWTVSVICWLIESALKNGGE